MFKVYKRASKLPNSWDGIAKDNIFMSKSRLMKLEKSNPCDQLYHLDQNKKIALISYKLKIDLFTFASEISLKVPVNIIGIPMSVSKCGYALDSEGGLETLNKYIKNLKGFYVVLNSNENFKIPKGNTLPTYRMEIRWNTLEDYIISMRSHYRYRLKKAMKRFKNVKVEELSNNSLFNEEMYQLYCNVYKNSNEKLEKLSIDFFRSYPARILRFSINKEIIAFVQLVENNEELIFLFGGFKYEINKKYDLYINILLEIIKYGIDKGFKYIDFGQTAGETKSKLGAIQHLKYMYVHHSNPIINALLNKLVGEFSYKKYPIFHNVFKGGKR